MKNQSFKAKSIVQDLKNDVLLEARPTVWLKVNFSIIDYLDRCQNSTWKKVRKREKRRERMW
jgi:hypothetical protein